MDILGRCSLLADTCKTTVVIVSHEYKFVFVKTRKTGSTSVEAFLAQHAGEDAIVTEIRPPVAGHVARNAEGYANHMGASDIRDALGDEIWSSYFTFCVERNSWDKVRSAYRWQGIRRPFNEWVCRQEHRTTGILGGLPVDFDLYSLDGTNIAVDGICQYDRLAAALTEVLQHVGLKVPVELPREKALTPRPVEPYDVQAEEVIRRAFRREISAFGYVP